MIQFVKALYYDTSREYVEEYMIIILLSVHVPSGHNGIVKMHWTDDKWNSVNITEAAYCFVKDDKYIWRLYLSKDQPWNELEFALCFIDNGIEEWDNNNGVNYLIRPTITNLRDDSNFNLYAPTFYMNNLHDASIISLHRSDYYIIDDNDFTDFLSLGL